MTPPRAGRRLHEADSNWNCSGPRQQGVPWRSRSSLSRRSAGFAWHSRYRPAPGLYDPPRIVDAEGGLRHVSELIRIRNFELFHLLHRTEHMRPVDLAERAG